MSDDIVNLLQASVGLPDGYGNFGRLRNPDGPEAAARIRELEAEAAALREGQGTRCIVCGGPVDTVEEDDGGSADGCEIDAGWVCSSVCYDAALTPATVTVGEAVEQTLQIVCAEVGYSVDDMSPETQAALRALASKDDE